MSVKDSMKTKVCHKLNYKYRAALHRIGVVKAF